MRFAEKEFRPKMRFSPNKLKLCQLKFWDFDHLNLWNVGNRTFESSNKLKLFFNVNSVFLKLWMFVISGVWNLIIFFFLFEILNNDRWIVGNCFFFPLLFKVQVKGWYAVFRIEEKKTSMCHFKEIEIGCINDKVSIWGDRTSFSGEPPFRVCSRWFWANHFFGINCIFLQ